MKQFITAQISTGDLIHQSSVYPDTSAVTASHVKTNIAEIKGIAESDLSVLEITDPTTLDRIKNGDSFDLVWTGSDLTGLDFSPEESKRYVKITSDKENIVANGTATATITIEIWKADLSEIDTSINTNVLLDVKSSFYGIIKQLVQISAGTSTISFSTDIPGTWAFPADPERYENFRVDNQVIITSFLN